MSDVSKRANLRDKHILVKFTSFEHHRAQAKADRYTKGNLSEWLRYSATLEPRPEDIKVEVPKPAPGEEPQL